MVSERADSHRPCIKLGMLARGEQKHLAGAYLVLVSELLCSPRGWQDAVSGSFRGRGIAG